MMAKMKSDAPLDYALLQLSPKRSRCELFVSSNGSTEKIASGLLKPFVAHLKVAEDQVASAAQSVTLEVGKRKNAEVWFTKGTLERFVRFVSTPEVLELVATFDSEMSQLEAARKIYSQGPGDQLSGGMTAADDATKKELLRAIDVRLVAVQEDLTTTCARAAAAGFNIDTVSELQMFADRFGAHRLNEACCRLISLCDRRPDLMNQWRPVYDDRIIRSSCGSDMSIDVDDLPSSPPLDQEQPATCQHPNLLPSLSSNCTINRESSVEREAVEKKKESFSTSDQNYEPSVQASQPSRRLSVQDRINLFENKQKETSGGKPTIGKSSELRRMSSDVSSSGTMLLRRWSGASDMSIDLSFEKKESENPSDSQSIASVSQSKPSEEKKALNLFEKVVGSDSVIPEIKVMPSLGRVGDTSELKGGSFSKLDSNCNLGPVENVPLKEQVSNPTQSISFSSRGEHQDNSEEKSLPDGKSMVVLGLGDQGKLKDSQNSEELSDTIEGMTSLAEVARVKDSSSLTRFRPSGSKGAGQSKILNEMEDSEIRNQTARQSRSKFTHKTLGESGLSEGGPGSRIREAFAARYKGNGGDTSPAHPDLKSVADIVGVEKKESHSSEKVASSSLPSFEDSGPQRMKFHKQGLVADQSTKAENQRDESSSDGIIGGPFSGKFSIDTEEIFDSFKTPPLEQVEIKRQPKGNQELNNELKMKANELEKLFAEHKLRVPADQSHSGFRGRPAKIQHESSLYHSKPVVGICSLVSENYQATESNRSSKNTSKLDAASVSKSNDDQKYGDTLSKEFSELSVSDGSRGKFYDRYTEKRDAKLREDWSSKRAEKEARLKSLEDSLERSKSDLKAKFSASEDKQDSLSNARRRAERLRSFNSRSIMKRKQQHLDFGDGEDDEEALNFLEQNHLQEDVPLDHTTFVDGVSAGAQGKKLWPNNRGLSSSTGNSGTTGSRSAIRTSGINSRRRRTLPENPLIQSVPNFSELRKENTKPSSGASKSIRSQVRNYSCSKSNIEEAAVVKDEKPHQSQSLRKSSVNQNELMDVSPLDSDGAALTSIKFDEEVPKNVAAKPFLRKGSRTSYFARASITKQRASVRSEPTKNEEGNNALASEKDDFENTGKDEGEEEFETLNAEGHEVLDNEEPSLVMETKFFDSGSKNGDNKMTFSQLDKALGSQLPTVVPSGFHPVESMQDWPGESPRSWKSRIQHSFSYPHDLSDVDASVDSPVGSPASWNSQSLSQVESDAARMRKKWGTAQKPILGSNSSNNISRKDMTKGFKRFLKFGRKNRGSESLVDWISATTSEGDDDIEDGRDPANRSLEDLRKSRMGFSHTLPTDDSFNEGEFFNEQVPPSQSSIPAPPANFRLREDQMLGSSIKAQRPSFFSLSTFRSKGGDTKHR